MPKNEKTAVLNIDRIAFGGMGVGSVEGKVYFVPRVLPGEKVSVIPRKEKASYTTCELVEVLEPSPQRIEALHGFEIEKLGKTGKSVPLSPGYCYYYCNYETEIDIKQKQFEDLLERIGGIDKSVCLPPSPSPKSINYRNKITLHCKLENGEMLFGYVGSDQSSVLDLEECPLAVSEINELLKECVGSKSFIHTLKDGMDVIFRYTDKGGAELWRNSPNKKDSWLKEETAIGLVSVPKGSFFQVNIGASNILINEVQSYLEDIKPDFLLDFYCGCGLFALTAAKAGVPNVIGIDSDKGSIVTAKYNAENLDCDNIRFYGGEVKYQSEKALDLVDPEKSCLVVDPPRAGIDRRSMQMIINAECKHIIYISCSPDTLSRDIKRLTKNGYRVNSTKLVDMFPRTAHFETITRLELV